MSKISLRSFSTITRLDVAPRFSHAVVHDKTVYLTGQVPDKSTLELDAAKQTESILKSIESLLDRAGSDKSRILSATCYFTNIERDFQQMNEVWTKWLPPGAAPARTSLAGIKLADPLWKLEITVVAALK
jgi:enamine deaminase RidA (YjgF/YER057c/UK114 family)